MSDYEYSDCQVDEYITDAVEEVIADYRKRLAIAEQALEQLRVAFRHHHVSSNEGDACEWCGLDIRNEIHITKKQQQGAKNVVESGLPYGNRNE